VARLIYGMITTLDGYTEDEHGRSRIEREFDGDAVRRLKAESPHDITVDGPELAAEAIRLGLVDEFQMTVCPVIVGGGSGSSQTV
jgi:dihydrofolate reductase